MRLRWTGLSAVALCAVWITGVMVPPASAEPGSLGWLRVTPATGTIDDAIDVLAQGRCPEGESIVVTVSGQGVPTSGNVGNIVGNTALTALPATESGQLYVPLQVPLRLWFAQNAPGVTPQGRYVFRLVCRDKIRSSVVYGSFDGAITVTPSGTYRALGEAAEVSNTPKVQDADPTEPEGTSPESGNATSGTAPEDEQSAMRDTPTPSTSPSAPTASEAAQDSTTASPAPSPSASVTSRGVGQEAAAELTAPTASKRPESGTLRWLLIAAAAVVLVSGLLFAARRPKPTQRGESSSHAPD